RAGQEGPRHAQHVAAGHGHRARAPLQPRVGGTDAQVGLRQDLRSKRRLHLPGELDAEPELAYFGFFFELKLSPFTTRGLIARCREPGTSPSAVEMSVAASRIAPGFGAFPSQCSGAHASPPAKLTS